MRNARYFHSVGTFQSWDNPAASQERVYLKNFSKSNDTSVERAKLILVKDLAKLSQKA